MPSTGSLSSADSPNASRSPAKRGQACVRCWKRKQKCDRVLPACSACNDVGADCVARSQDIKTLLADDASLSHSSIASYVESLKRRVAELENGVQSPPNKRPRTTSYQESTVIDNGVQDGNAAATEALEVAQDEQSGGEDSSVRDTMGAIGFLSNSAMAEPRPGPREGSPNGLALTEVVMAALAIAGNDPSTAGPSQPALVLDDYQVPLSRESTLEYFRLYLEWAFFVPYLDHGRLLEHFEETVSKHGTPIAADVPPLHRFNAYMSVATGIMISPDANRFSFLSSSLHALSVKLVPLVLTSQNQLEAVHVMTMFLVYSLFCSSGGSAWHLLGLAMKTSIALGLHKDMGTQVGSDFDGEIDPRWLFWTLYIFDRSLSSVMDRPFSIQDTDISQQIPPESDSMTPSTADVTKAKHAASRHFIRQAQLLSHIRDNNLADPMSAYHNLCFWRDSPPILRNAPVHPRLWSDSVERLACRSLMHIVNPIQQAHTAPGILRGTAEEVEADTIDSCRRLIGNSYDRSGTGSPAVTFIAAYDILSAVVILTCLSRRLGKQDPQSSAGVFESINKASAVVTQIAGRFPALRAFQELLLKISARMMEEHTGRTQDFCNTLQGLPVIIPRRLRQFIQNAFP